MNTLNNKSRYSREQAFSERIVQRLSEAENDLPRDVSERLKAARALALSKRKVVPIEIHATGLAGNTLILGGPFSSTRWNVFGSLVPLVALVIGLLAIGPLQDQYRAVEVAEVDTELLTDELPPAAFTDPGFLEYLRSTNSSLQR
ncbi:DUF3619 family protein [Rhodoferax aquaticus]|uniref:DUF3619 family protein n=1 Tax=Rhodoferax aquaticus TaxID=2527691 RepID=A0A515EQ99_9BURK|nr:DUF3619 family protein [Rhodoferax aquaticus]QDL54851.1 DUF3619 family protein [Rhodoferax aquaticus]